MHMTVGRVVAIEHRTISMKVKIVEVAISSVVVRKCLMDISSNSQTVPIISCQLGSQY